MCCTGFGLLLVAIAIGSEMSYRCSQESLLTDPAEIMAAYTLSFYVGDFFINGYALLKGFHHRLAKNQWLVVACCLLVVSSLGLWVMTFQPTSIILAVAAIALFGLSSGWLFLIWTVELGELKLWILGLCIIADISFMRLIRAVVSFADLSALVCLLLASVFASLLLLYRYRSKKKIPLETKQSESLQTVLLAPSENSDHALKHAVNALWKPLTGAVLCALISGLSWSVFDISELTQLFSSLIATVVMILLGVVLYFLRDRYSLTDLLRLLLPIATVLLIIAPFAYNLGNDFVSAFTNPLNSIAFLLFDSLILTCAIAYASGNGASVIRVVAFCRMLCAGAMMLGLVGSLIVSVSETQVAFLIILSCYLLALTLSMNRSKGSDTANASERSSRSPETDTNASDQTFEETIKSIAEKYNLSPRETEVFSYLARGHGSAYIAEKLIVSNETVKTHIKRIYRKIGISSREEMLALLERL